MLKLISLNIERSKHLHTVLPFLERERPDVLCVQELMERDIPALERVMRSTCVFAPGTMHDAEGDPGVMGVGMLTTLPLLSHRIEYYWGSKEGVSRLDLMSAAAKHATEAYSLTFFEVEAHGQSYVVVTTHFTWTPDGRADEYQRGDLQTMLSILEKEKELILCGDFNAPRGGEIFGVLASRYKDNIPPEYKTSLDLELHRAVREGRRHELEDKMVDGLFTSGNYSAKNVRLVTGVSDHCAIVADITKQ